MKKELEVTIKRSGKLTLTEINALTEKIIQETNEKIKHHNNMFKVSPQYKKELKALKTKTGVLSAERSIVFLAQKHKKVSFSVVSEDFTNGLAELDKKYKKSYINSYKDCSMYKIIKNELILSQVNSSSMEALKGEIIIRNYINS